MILYKKRAYSGFLLVVKKYSMARLPRIVVICHWVRHLKKDKPLNRGRSLAVELAPIRVNVVSPGFVAPKSP